MKNVSHICLVLFTMVFFTTCKKKITEPEHKLKGRQLIYIEVDGKKFEIIDKKFQWYKNTKGTFRKTYENNNKIIKFSYKENIYLKLEFYAIQSLKNEGIFLQYSTLAPIDSINVLKGTIFQNSSPANSYLSDNIIDAQLSLDSYKNKRNYIYDNTCTYYCGSNCKVKILEIDENKKRVQAQIWLKLINSHPTSIVNDTKNLYIYLDANY